VRDGVADYIRKNRLEKPVIVGHSLGGFVALEVAAKYPDLPGRIVIVDAYPLLAGEMFLEHSDARLDMKALIVDDERLARVELRRLLAAHPEVEIASEARSGEEALELLAKLAPDVMFLDIQMPGLAGMDLLERVEDMPQVIFTTAYDRYALQAFEVNALDYLLKPVAPARLAAALAKLRPRMQQPRLEQVFARRRPALDRVPAGDFPAGIGRELYARALRERASTGQASTRSGSRR
jgi:CheY-like chemotaxis protein